MKKISVILIIVILLLANLFQFSYNQFAHRLFTDAVPTEAVALEVGKAVIAGAFGRGELDREVIVWENSNNTWTVFAPLPDGLGWSYEIVIRKRDGKILKMHAI